MAHQIQGQGLEDVGGGVPGLDRQGLVRLANGVLGEAVGGGLVAGGPGTGE